MQHHHDYIEAVSAKGPASLSAKMKIIFIILMVIGFGTFAGILLIPGIEQKKIAWISFLHNFYFFTGLSAAGLVLAAILQAARANWGRPFKRFAEAFGAFLPVSILGLVVLYFGAAEIWEWVAYPPDENYYHNKHMWLTKNFVFMRVAVYLAILLFLSHMFRKASDRTDFGLAHEKNPDLWPQPANWKGLEQEVEAGQKTQSRYGVLYCVGYAVCISMIAYDLIMSLDYRWFSTMFGGWNFTTFMLIAWGSMVWVCHFMSRRFGLEKYFHEKLYHDLGKLTFGFTVVWGYLFFAQYLVIWYGNLPHETGYLITRFYDENWRPFTLTVFALVFLVPFILGLSKKLKLSPKTFGWVVLISVIGVWLERFVLIGPSVWYYTNNADPALGSYDPGIGKLLFFDIVIFLGFLGLFAWCFANYLYKRPLMVISDPRLDEGINRH